MEKVINYNSLAVRPCFLTKYFFPPKRSTNIKDPKLNIRGVDLKLRSLEKEITRNRTLNAILIAVFGTVMVDSFTDERRNFLL